MAYSAISTGSVANDGTGDTLRDGATKVNSNFSEVYNKLGNGTDLSSGITADATNVTLTAPILSGVTTTASGNLQVKPASHILEVQGDGTNAGTVGQIRLNCSANSHGQTIASQPHNQNVTNTMLLPKGASSTLVSLVSVDTLQNKTLTSPTISTPDIDGGNIDGAIIGANTPAAITGTAISGTSMAVTGTAGAMTLNTVSTTQRNALSVANGMVVYNSTDSKIQAYAGGAWVDLH
tara:strand:+ start:3214 stop:3921 length:708 start_codon:yes stop_codon:yes gene_type:complete